MVLQSPDEAARQRRAMNEGRIALGAVLQTQAMMAGAELEGAAELALSTLAQHEAEIRTWDTVQAMIAEVREAARGAAGGGGGIT